MPSCIVEEGIGRGVGVPGVFVQRTVDRVGSRLGHQRYLCSGAAAHVGPSVGGCGSKLLDRIECRSQHAGKRGSKLFVIHVYAIQRNIALIALAAIDGAAAIIVTLAGIAEISDAGLNREQADDVSCVEGQFENRTCADGIADAWRPGVLTCTVSALTDTVCCTAPTVK